MLTRTKENNGLEYIHIIYLEFLYPFPSILAVLKHRRHYILVLIL